MSTPRQRLARAEARLTLLNQDSAILAQQLRQLNKLRERVGQLDQLSTKPVRHYPCARASKPSPPINP